MKISLDSLFYDSTSKGLEKSLDLSWKRNQAITSNIANADTPQYRAVDLSFGNELKAAFEKNDKSVALTNQKHLDLEANSGAHFVADLSGSTKADGNNVDIDLEMGQLSYNGGKYSSAARMLRKKLGLIRMAIREGGR